MQAVAGGHYQDHFRSWLVGRRLVQATTAADYQRDLERVSRHAEVLPIALRHYHVEAFLADPRYSWSTKQRGLIAVRMWHRWGADRGYWPLDPDLVDTRLRHRPIPDPDALTLPQVVKLLQAAKSTLHRRLVYPGLFAGLRPAEIRFLDPKAWFHGPGGHEQLKVQGKQTSPPRKVPVHPLLSSMREELLSVTPSRKQLLRAARELRSDIDVEGFTPKWLRATFSQALSDSGVQRSVIGALLGHSSLGVTSDHYAPPTQAEMSSALRLLPYGNIRPHRARTKAVQLCLF